MNLKSAIIVLVKGQSQEEEEKAENSRASLVRAKDLPAFACLWIYVCDLTDLVGALSGEVNRPKPGANVLVGVWERLIRTRSKRL